MTQYAPVIIATLNRYAYLKRCLESLEKNTDAEKTEVYVSVDFPPSEKYYSGYEEVVKYLKHKEKKNAFKKLNVFYQSWNLGVAANFDFLRDQVMGKYSTYIGSEDDNEFAVNFLQYMNKGLEIFKDDERIIAISGYKGTFWEYPKGTNVTLVKLFSAYGFGKWIEKEERVETEIQKMVNDDTIRSLPFQKLKKEDRTLYNLLILSVLLGDKKPFWYNGNLIDIDSVVSIYMHLHNCYVVVPSICKSRTWGNDGSGENSKKLPDFDPIKDRPLDTADTFNYQINYHTITSLEEYRNECFAFDQMNDYFENEYMRLGRNQAKNFKADLGLILLRLCKFDIKKAKRIKKIFEVNHLLDN